MITKNIPGAYQELFAAANEALKTYKSIDANISDIDDYFRYIGDLAEIELTNSIDPIFTILPATEATFDINANTREIIIPDTFKKYGVGVKGDEIAEILYFSIDRYFDAMDLANMDILIQWQYETKNNSVNDTFLSATYKKSLTFKPGKIVFGWPITSEITTYAGNIKFSVRFYERDEDKLIYNFETLPATIKIQNSLNIELNDAALESTIDKNQMIHARLRNSTVISNEILAVPSFGTNQWVLIGEQLQNHIDSKAYDTLVPFVAKATYADDTNPGFTTHEIEYKWNGNGVTASYYLEATHYNPYEVYYKIDAEGQNYVPEKVANKEAFDASEVILYVKATQFTPATAGSYSVTAINEGETKKTETNTSYIWIITGPEAPTFESITSPVYIDHEDASTGYADIYLDYILNSGEGESVTLDQWIFNPVNAEPQELTTDDTEDVYLIDNNGSVYCRTKIEGSVTRKIEVTKNNASADATSNAVIAYYKAGTPSKPVLEINDGVITASIDEITKGLGTLSYEWSESEDGVMHVIANTTTNTYQPKSSGFYFCKVTNTYQNTTATSELSDVATIIPN